MTEEHAPARSAQRTDRRSRLVAASVMVAMALCGFLAGMAVDRRLLLSRRSLLPAMSDGSRPPGGIGMPPLPGGVMPGFGPGAMKGLPPRPPIAEIMERELGLDAAQKARIDSIVDVQMREMQTMMEPMRARADSLLERTRSAIDATLTPDQRAKLDARRRRGFVPPAPG